MLFLSTLQKEFTLILQKKSRHKVLLLAEIVPGKDSE